MTFVTPEYLKLKLVHLKHAAVEEWCALVKWAQPAVEA